MPLMKTRLLIWGLCVALVSGSKLLAQETPTIQTFYYSTGEPKKAVTPKDSTRFTIKEITVVGNKRTRRSTVLREMAFHVGETYRWSKIIAKLEASKRQLMNTSLFRTAEVSLLSVQDSSVSIAVTLEEKWYFYPEPFIRVANGSFSQWSERGRNFDQLNYGLKLKQYNFSGRGDKMNFQVTNGYTKKLALQYQGFYLDKALKWSSSVNFAYGKNRELNYATENNKLLPVKTPDGFIYEFYQTSVDVTYRPAIRTKHTFTVGYNNNRVGDTVRKLNIFYTPSDNTYSYPYFTYTLQFTDFDYNPYPTRGLGGDVSLTKAGFGGAVNLWQLSAKGTRYWPVSTKTFFSLNVGGVLKLPFTQPYVTQGFLGYGDAYLQGYENYYVDGVAGGYAKATIGYKLFKKDFAIPKIKWFKSLHSVPVQVFLKSYANTGYAYNPNYSLYNGLNNKALFSTGLGLDLLLFTDTVFKLEWSFNQMGQNGLYLH